MVINNLTLDIGTIIKFRTHNPQDTNIWQGPIISFATYRLAQRDTDVAAYHQQVLVAEPALDPVEELHYILVECIEADGVIRAFAAEWIDVATLSIVDTSNNATFKVFNVTTEQALIIKQLLQDNNFSCKQL